MGDIRVSMAPLLATFGLAITVMRPTPDDDSVASKGIWDGSADDAQPYGADFDRVGPRSIMSIPLSAALPTLPNGTVILAPDEEGGAVKTWRVDGRVVPDLPDVAQVFLKRIAD